ncbi:MAG: single-stranded DNA-binding protein [Synechococcaceae cyanobacterium]|nr:single-stranded DNA-binding protein [Synechococcaceae cyanobacterium]
MNHCLLEAEVLEAPQLRYTQDNQTPVAEMTVRIDGLRPDDPPGQLKVVGWGSLAQEIQNRLQVGQRLVLEGRLRMNTVARPDGVKEKRAELTLSRLHPLGGDTISGMPPASASPGRSAAPSRPAGAPRSSAPPADPPPAAPTWAPSGAGAQSPPPAPAIPAWDPSPLVPREPIEPDDIPF